LTCCARRCARPSPCGIRTRPTCSTTGDARRSGRWPPIWNNAFGQTHADFIATFDADHVPRPDFLDRTLGFFRDPKVALVQVPQQYHNLDSIQHRVSWKARRMYGEQDSFFNLVMPGKDNWNAAFFCGTGAVLRRQALEPHGGILTGTITEDLHTSVVLHSEGWKSVYLNEVLVTGLAPFDLASFATQRLRWAEGNLKAAGLANPLTIPGLTVKQRIAYFASLFHWTIGVPKLIYYLAPPWMLFTGTFPIAHFDRTFVTIYLAFLATLIGSYEIVSRGKGRLLMDELFNMVSVFTLLRAIKRVLFGRGKPSRFEVTSKHGHGERDLGPVLPHLLLLGFSALAISWSLMGLGFGINEDVKGASTGIFWSLYNATLMIAVIRLGSRPPEKRAGCRYRGNFAVEARGTGAEAGRLGVTADLSEQGCTLLWPNALEVGSRLPIRIHFGPRSVEWTGEISSEQERKNDGWYRYGLSFADFGPAEVDLINDIVFGLVVPDLLTTLSQPSWLIRLWRRIVNAIDRRITRRASRQVVRVPVRVQHAGGTFVTTVRDLSSTGLGVQAPTRLATGTEVTLTMVTPARTWQGTASVARSEVRTSRAGFDTWILGLRFEREQTAADVLPFRQWDAA
jgi:cellulose synthase (UDP-forming)